MRSAMNQNSFYRRGRGGMSTGMRFPPRGDSGTLSNYIHESDVVQFLNMKRAEREQQYYSQGPGGMNYPDHSMNPVGPPMGPSQRKRPYSMVTQDGYMPQRMGPRGPDMGFRGPMNTNFSRGGRISGNRGNQTRRFVKKKKTSAGQSGDRQAKKSKRKDRGPSVAPTWTKAHYYCWFCKVDTIDKKSHGEHLQSANHGKKVKERTVFLRKQARNALEMSFEEVQNQKMSGREVNYCMQCCLEFAVPQHLHKASQMHKSMMYTMAMACSDCKTNFTSRLNYELHAVSFNHLRNQRYNMVKRGTAEDDAAPEEYDSEEPVGTYYVTDVKCHYCRVCVLYFPGSVDAHCKQEVHYNNLKIHLEEKKKETPLKEAEMEIMEAKEDDEAKDDESEPEAVNEEDEEEEEVEMTDSQNGVTA